jgi:hypothetical protein
VGSCSAERSDCHQGGHEDDGYPHPDCPSPSKCGVIPSLASPTEPEPPKCWTCILGIPHESVHYGERPLPSGHEESHGDDAGQNSQKEESDDSGHAGDHYLSIDHWDNGLEPIQRVQRMAVCPFRRSTTFEERRRASGRGHVCLELSALGQRLEGGNPGLPYHPRLIWWPRLAHGNFRSDQVGSRRIHLDSPVVEDQDQSIAR